MQWITLSKRRPTHTHKFVLISMPLCDGQRSPDRDQVSPATSSLFTLFVLVILAVNITFIGERPLMIRMSGGDVSLVDEMAWTGVRGC